ALPRVTALVANASRAKARALQPEPGSVSYRGRDHDANDEVCGCDGFGGGLPGGAGLLTRRKPPRQSTPVPDARVQRRDHHAVAPGGDDGHDEPIERDEPTSSGAELQLRNERREHADASDASAGYRGDRHRSEPAVGSDGDGFHEPDGALRGPPARF